MNCLFPIWLAASAGFIIGFVVACLFIVGMGDDPKG
jgi:hypothetical protein